MLSSQQLAHPPEGDYPDWVHLRTDVLTSDFTVPVGAMKETSPALVTILPRRVMSTIEDDPFAAAVA
jgi:hypothetical protein